MNDRLIAWLGLDNGGTHFFVRISTGDAANRKAETTEIMIIRNSKVTGEHSTDSSL
jgi:hypothetical protein